MQHPSATTWTPSSILILVPHTTSPLSRTNSQCVRSMTVPTKCTRPVGQVCLLAISVNLQFTLKIVTSFSRMFSMFLVLRRTRFLFISSHMITMLSLKFILGIFFLRIGTRGNRFFTKDVGMASTLYLLSSYPSKESLKVFWPPSNHLWHGGTIVSAMPLLL
jgi:hypothetical protein